MTRQRLRAVGVTMAMILGAGTVSAIAAPLLRGDTEFAAEPTPTESASEATEDPTETVTETVPEEPTEDTVVDEPKARDDERTRREKARAAAKKAERKAAQAKRKATHGNHGHGNAHGKAVSAAARGETEPVGDCRNHGHWVSTVAKGLDSCNDNPRPAGEDADS